MIIDLRRHPGRRRAAEGPHRAHALRHSRTLSEITGAEVWVKFENLQFTAAYKERGALNKLLQLTDDERKRGVIAASAGNHARAWPTTPPRLGMPVTIVMPRTTPFVKVEQTRAFGAEVVHRGRQLRRGRRARASTLCDEREPDLRPPVQRPGRDGRPGHRRAGDARGRAGPRGPAGPDRRRRADRRRGHGGQARQPGHPDRRRRAGDVPVLHRPHARRGRRAGRRPDHRRGHRGQGRWATSPMPSRAR